MNSHDNTPGTPASEQTFNCDENPDLVKAIEHTINWHARAMASLRHLLTIPPGMVVTVSNSMASVTSSEGDANNPVSEQEVVLDGDAHAAFVAGITVALGLLERPPFVAVTADDGNVHVQLPRSN